MTLLFDTLSWVMLAGGVFLGISGAVGVLRFPDFYTRLHAAGVTDTLCSGMILGGLMVQSGFNLITLKLCFILFLVWYTSPIAGHALAQAALHAGIVPKTRSEGVSPSQP